MFGDGMFPELIRQKIGKGRSYSLTRDFSLLLHARCLNGCKGDEHRDGDESYRGHFQISTTSKGFRSCVSFHCQVYNVDLSCGVKDEVTRSFNRLPTMSPKFTPDGSHLKSKVSAVLAHDTDWSWESDIRLDLQSMAVPAKYILSLCAISWPTLPY